MLENDEEVGGELVVDRLSFAHHVIISIPDRIMVAVASGLNPSIDRRRHEKEPRVIESKLLKDVPV